MPRRSACSKPPKPTRSSICWLSQRLPRVEASPNWLADIPLPRLETFRCSWPSHSLLRARTGRPCCALRRQRPHLGGLEMVERASKRESESLDLEDSMVTADSRPKRCAFPCNPLFCKTLLLDLGPRALPKTEWRSQSVPSSPALAST